MFIFINALSAFAGPGKTTYQAKIVKPDGYPLEVSSVNFKFTILDPAGSCILYSETYSSVNMSGTGGLISFALGSGVKTYPASATTFEQVFSNVTPTLSCDAGGPANYSPASNDIRKIVMQFHDGSGWQTLPAMSINAVPYAMYANEATKLNGLTSSELVQVSTVPTCAASEALRYTGAGFTCVAVGNSVTSGTVVTALGYTPADGVSVTVLSSNVSSVSSTVFSVSSTVTSLQNSVAASFAAITSSQWTTSGTNIFYNTGNIGIGTTTPVTKLDVSGGVRIGAESTTCAPALAGTLRYNASNVEYCNGTSWQAFGVSGSGITNFNGSTSGTQSFATGTGGTAPAFNTLNGVHTLNIPLASTGSVTGGLISNTDYTTFTNKITSSAASIAQVLGYIPADNSVSGTYAQKANNLSDLTNVATARTNLGLGTFATASSIDLGSASATGTLAIARLPNFTGDATITAASNTIILSNSGVTAGTYTKVTVDSKGRVTSSSALASSDVTTALGYTPASASASTQWTTSGSAIYYNTGNVGIGVINPGQKFMVDGNAEVLAGNYFKLWSPDNTSNSLTFSATNSAASISQSSGPLYIHSLGFEWANDDKGGATSTITNSGETTRSLTLTTSNLKDIFIKPAANTLITNGNVGIGITAPVAKLHLTSGTTSVAPFKFTSGTLLTSPQSGTMEYDGVNFYLTDSTNTRRAIAANTNPGTYDNVSNINSSSNITLTPTGSVVVSSTAASTNSSTGALVVKGGLGVAENLNVAGTISGSAKVLATGFRANQGVPDNNDSSTNGYAFGADGDTGIFSPGTGAANGVLAFYGNNAEVMRLANGKVGIGTTGPFDTLEVSGTLSVAAGANNRVILADNRTVTVNASSPKLSFFGATDDAVNTVQGPSIQKINETSFGRGRLAFFQHGGADYTSESEVMSIAYNGNIGIGTTSPQAKLDVSGNIGTTTGVFYNSISSNTAQTILSSDSTAGTATANVAVWGASHATYAGDVHITNRTSGATRFYNYNGSTWTETVRITSGGNVGIGTTNPSYPFDVKNQMRVGAQGGSDVTLIAGGSGYGSQIYQYYADGVLKNVFSANGNSYITAGSFGIGTTSPSSPLAISGASTVASSPITIAMSGSGGFNSNLYNWGIHSAGDSNWGFRLNNPANGYYYTDVTGCFSCNTGGAFRVINKSATVETEFFRVNGNGNVGIGTNTPISPIHAYGGTAMTAGYNRTLTVHANHPSIQFKGISDSNHSGGILYDAQTSSEGMRFIVGATSDDVYGTGVNVMSLQANGNVGIGTNAPGARFHIADYTTAGGKNLLIGDDSFLTDVDVSNTLGIYGNQDSTQGHIRLGSSGPLISGYTGFVGIGNATPAYTLDVSGDLRITGTPYRNGGDITWTVPSDARLKDVMRAYDRGLRELANLDMIVFKYKKDNPKQVNSDKEYTGVIAQQVQEQIPEAVSVDKDGFLSLNTTPIFWAMINAIKELYNEVIGVSREVAAIKTENAELKKQNAEIKAYLCAKDPNAPMCK